MSKIHRTLGDWFELSAYWISGLFVVTLITIGLFNIDYPGLAIVLDLLLAIVVYNAMTK